MEILALIVAVIFSIDALVELLHNSNTINFYGASIVAALCLIIAKL